MRIKSFLLQLTIITVIAGSTDAQGQSVAEALKTINESSLKAQLGFLASDWTEGRESETKGAFLAGDYIASIFQVFGIEPCGDTEYSILFPGQTKARPEARSSYFQKFNIVKYKKSDKQSLSLINELNGSRLIRNFEYDIDYNLYGIETDTEIEAPVVFVGYGIRNDSLKYNDFANVNVKGKIIVRLDGFPGFRDTTSGSFKKLKFSNLWNSKERWAIEAGAAGVINIPSNPNKDFGKVHNFPFRHQSGEIEADNMPETYYDEKAILANDSIKKTLPVIRISVRLQNELTELMNIDLNSFEQNAMNSLKSNSKEIKGLRIGLKSGIQSKLVTVRNVLGMIEGVNKNEFIVVGAHYDHLGKYNGYIYNGADDNGSGTVGVMSIARAIKATGRKPEKTIIFAAWTAEERGLLGSEYFVNNFPGPFRIFLNVNFDMIGRCSVKDTVGNKCGVEFTKVYNGFQELLQKQLKDWDLNLDIKYTGSDKPSGGSDYASFAERDIPVISFMAAMHPDYHRPSDEVSKIEWKKMEQIIKLGFLSINELVNSDLKKYKIVK